MESEALKSGVPLKGFVSLCREILTRFIEQHFPVVIEGSVSWLILLLNLLTT